MTAVAPWGENSEDAYDQGLVELGLGDTRLIEAKDFLFVNCVWGENSLIDSIILSKKEIR